MFATKQNLYSQMRSTRMFSCHLVSSYKDGQVRRQSSRWMGPLPPCIGPVAPMPSVLRGSSATVGTTFGYSGTPGSYSAQKHPEESNQH